MDVVGSEIGHKMRSAIKAKLTELGCYVDDELPDYVMVMVANKRTQAQMEDDLQLFLGDNTELFVNWLHQVLKKLQEVTVAVPLKTDSDKTKERSGSKDRKSKEKKDKEMPKKSDVFKKSKKKNKEKFHDIKEMKIQKNKKEKKSRNHERIRPNIPPLLMNMEKDSEPSITDVFAGQILKNHGVTVDTFKEDLKIEDTKLVIEKRVIKPIIDPTTILEPESKELNNCNLNKSGELKDNQLNEINEIEAKIQGLKQKLVEQLDYLSDDEDFLNIRTEADDFMNDFTEDVIPENKQPTTLSSHSLDGTAPISTPKDTLKPVTYPCIATPKSPTESSKYTTKSMESKLPPALKPLSKDPIEILPQIELNLPKRPIRERLGLRNIAKKTEAQETNKKKILSPESFTPEREIEKPTRAKSSKSRVGRQMKAKSNFAESPDRGKASTRKLTSKVSSLDNNPVRVSCASVVRVRPRPRPNAPASNLLLRAVADAHKSLLNKPPKVEHKPTQVKRALVLPMRRCVDPLNIVIEVAARRQTDDRNNANDNIVSHRFLSKTSTKEEYTPLPISKRITNTDYVPSRTATHTADSLVIETINLHNPTVDKDKDTKFIVTMDGYHPNAFLAKKLITEGITDDDGESEKLKALKVPKENENIEPQIELLETDEDVEMMPVEHIPKDKEPESIEKMVCTTTDNTVLKQQDITEKVTNDKEKQECKENDSPISSTVSLKKRSSDTSEDSVIVKQADETVEMQEISEVTSVRDSEKPIVKKRKRSPIVFDVDKKEKETGRERSVSASSDSNVTLNTNANPHKYDSVPQLSQAVPNVERSSAWCRSFPLCRWGPSCAFLHPRCKFAASCTRRNCVYAHSPVAGGHVPSVASHVVPAANYKSISSSIPSLCKFYPNCINSSCHFYHPKPCRFGKACLNKLECNFFHAEVPGQM